MSRSLRLAGAAPATAAVVLAITATGASGVGPSLPIHAPSAPIQAQSPAVPALPAPPSAPVKVPVAPSAPAAATAPAAAAPPLPGVGAVIAASQPPRVTSIAAPGLASGARGASPAAAGSGSASAARSGAATRARARERAAAETRRLRAEVRRLRGCLGALPEIERHLLAMRVGLGGPAMTRRAAAQQLQISVGRAHRLERRGLRELRSESRRTGCGARSNQGFHAFSFGAATTTTPALHPAVTIAASAPTAAAPVPAGKPQRPRQGVLGETAKSPPPTGGRPSAPPAGSAISRSSSGGGHALVIALVLLLLAANLLAGGLWLLRKRRASGFAYEPGSRRRREYGDPDRELDFGTPERPRDSTREHATSEQRRDGET